MKRLASIFFMTIMSLYVMGQTITAREFIDITSGNITLSDLSQRLVARGFQKDFLNNDIVLHSKDCNITISPVNDGHFMPEIIAYTKTAMGTIVKQFKNLGWECTDRIEDNPRTGDLGEWMYSKKGFPNIHVYIGPRGYYCLEWAAPGSKLIR